MGEHKRLAVVLSGGGARAAYQVGVLSAIAERVPDLKVSVLSGVSAGAINTVTLAAHPGTFRAKVRALRDEWSHLRSEDVYNVRVGSLLSAVFRMVGQRLLRRPDRPVVRGVMDMTPLRHFMDRRVDLRGIDVNLRSGALEAVTLSATCYRPSETVTFVHGRGQIEMWKRAQRRAVEGRLGWDHVLASAAIPILFPAVRIGGRYYGDGSVRQGAPLAPPVHLGADKILAIGMRPTRNDPADLPDADTYPSAAQVMGMLFHSIFLDTLEADAERLARINRLVLHVPAAEREEIGTRAIDLLLVRPSRDLGAMARPHFDHLPPLMRSIVQALGGHQAGSADFVSYLLFDPAYTVPLMELGFRDACDDWSRISTFLEVPGDGPEPCDPPADSTGG